MAKGEDLSKRAGIPRSRIYDVLRRLEERGWIDSEHSRPIIYHPKAVKEIASKLTTEFTRNLEVLEQIKKLSLSRVEVKRPEISMIYGWSSIQPYIKNLVLSSDINLMIVLGFLYIPIIESLQLTLPGVRVPVSMIVSIEKVKKREMKALRKLSEVVEIRCVELMPKFCAFVSDFSILTFLLPSFKGEQIDPEHMIGLEITYPDFARWAGDIARRFWKESRPFE
jgi:sugar-specific transcriptional regulator TrmB